MSKRKERALALFVEHGVQINARVGPLSAAMHAALGEPDVAGVVELGEQRRAEVFRWTIQRLAEKSGGLRAGMSEEQATDILLVFCGAEVFQGFTAGRGWSAERCRRFLAELLTREILGE